MTAATGIALGAWENSAGEPRIVWQEFSQ